MSNITDLHNLAMEEMDEAFFARRSGNAALADQHNRKAFELEKQAANLLKDNFEAEPSRSVLYRSAASFAYECGEFREAEQLISIALSGNPPEEIMEELRDLQEQVNFNRHLDLRNVQIEKNEIQVSLSGNEVGFGWTESNIFIGRLQDFERIIFRTVERLLKQPFREHGAATSSIRSLFDLFLVAPRPSSFAITLRLGRQMSLPNMDITEEVMDEIMDCFQLLNNNEVDKLKERMDEPYLLNFIALAQRVAPDGEKVSQVGLTSLKNGTERRVSIKQNRRQLGGILAKIIDTEDSESESIILEGTLKFADGMNDEKPIIRIMDKSGKRITVVVPANMMDDIIHPLWNSNVTALVKKVKGKYYLKNIEAS